MKTRDRHAQRTFHRASGLHQRTAAGGKAALYAPAKVPQGHGVDSGGCGAVRVFGNVLLADVREVLRW